MKDKERLAQVNERRKAAAKRLERAGVTQSEVARRLSVPESTVSKVLSGQMPGRRGNAHKVAVALGIVEGELGLTVEDVLVGIPKAA